MADKPNLQIEQAKKALFALRDALKRIDEAKGRRLNIFNAVGMQTQEIKHSAFLAWLLNPEKPENIKFNFLYSFLRDVYVYSSNGIINSEIVNSALFKDDTELFKATEDKEIRVVTERQLVNGDGDGRIDIYIEMPRVKTVIVIENKTFTTSHDNQLERYVNEFEKTDWNKIFIYLTPKGDLPTEVHDKWCLYSYERINIILSEMIKTVTNRKLKYLIGDYINMVDTNILRGNKELNALCKQIRREHKDAVEILLAYTDNIELVQKYCVEWFNANVPNITFKGGKTTFEFYTEVMYETFKKNGQSIVLDGSNLWKCRCVFGYGENVPIAISLQKDADGEWDNVQKSIMNFFAPNKKERSKYFTFNGYTTELLTIEERSMDFESVKEQLDRKLNEFVIKLKKFEEILKTL